VLVGRDVDLTLDIFACLLVKEKPIGVNFGQQQEDSFGMRPRWMENVTLCIPPLLCCDNVSSSSFLSNKHGSEKRRGSQNAKRGSRGHGSNDDVQYLSLVVGLIRRRPWKGQVADRPPKEKSLALNSMAPRSVHMVWLRLVDN
jgi:hypothetical protein